MLRALHAFFPQKLPFVDELFTEIEEISASQMVHNAALRCFCTWLRIWRADQRGKCLDFIVCMYVGAFGIHKKFKKWTKHVKHESSSLLLQGGHKFLPLTIAVARLSALSPDTTSDSRSLS